MKQRLQALENGQFVSRTKIAKNRQEDSTTILELVCAKKKLLEKTPFTREVTRFRKLALWQRLQPLHSNG